MSNLREGYLSSNAFVGGPVALTGNSTAALERAVLLGMSRVQEV